MCCRSAPCGMADRTLSAMLRREPYENSRRANQIVRSTERIRQRAICEADTHNSQLQLEASDLGHCAVYEKELQRVWPITEENRRERSRSLGRNTDFGWHITSRGHCAIFIETSPAMTSELAKIAATGIRIGIKAISLFE